MLVNRRIRFVVAMAIAMAVSRAFTAAIQPDDLVSEARASLAAGRFDEAERLARLSGGPSDVLVSALIANGRAALDETVTLALDRLIAEEARVQPDDPALEPALLNLADVLVACLQFDQAIEVAARAVAIDERAFGADSLQVAAALDHVGAALAGAARYDAALASLERALGLKERQLLPGDVAIARTLEEIGGVLHRQGRYDPAGRAIRRAAAIQEAADAGHPARVKTLNLLADQAWFEGDLLASRSASEQALDLAATTLRPDHPITATTAAVLAATLADLGDLDRSVVLKRRALALAEQNFGAGHPATAEFIHGLGVAELRHGDYGPARVHTQQALRIFEAHYGAWHEHVATSLSVLALIDARLGDYRRALAEQSRAVSIHTRAGGADHPFVAIGLTELARVFNEEGRPAQALPLLQRALAIRQKRLGQRHRDVAVTLADLSSTLVALGSPTRAQALATQALDIWDQLQVPDAPEYATVLALSADLRARRADYNQALTFYDRALDIRARVFGVTHPIHAETQAALALVHAARGDAAAALSTASAAEATGRDHLRLMLQSLPERQALSYATTRPRGLDLILSLAGVVPEAVAPALDGAIRTRALVLDEIAARHLANRSPGAAERARARLVSAQQRLANLTVRGPGPLSAAQYQALLESTREESELAEQELATTNAEFRVEQSLAGAGLDDVARTLPADAALISFVRYARTPITDPNGQSATVASAAPRRPPVPSYLVFVVRPGRPPEAIRIGTAAWIDGLVAQWRADIVQDALSPAVPAAGPTAPAARASGAALRHAIWDPLVAHLEGARHVFVVPDGDVTMVPLAALPVGRGSYLLETGPVIHYLSAERDLLAGGRASRGVGLLAIGGPAFDSRPALPADPISSLRSPRSGCADFRSISFEALAGTVREVREVSGLWSSNANVQAGEIRTLVGREAAEGAFKLEAPGRRVLHLATHGFFLDGDCVRPSSGTRGVGGLSAAGRTRVDNPLRLSGLALAGANRRAQAKPDEDDGILTAEEVAMLDLHGVEWAVLSACDTGVGEIKAGEGVFGLRRAFQVAGARTVIMSLWSVDDQATRAWMRALYEGRFQRELSTADAVHQASLTVLRDRRARGQSTHPFFWAAFVAAGDWR